MSRWFNPLAPRKAAQREVGQIKQWMREAYGLGEDVCLSVTQLTCRETGCPDIETVIAIMRPGRTVQTIRLQKGIRDILEMDVAATRHAGAHSAKE
jgi:hypothetical protein